MLGAPSWLWAQLPLLWKAGQDRALTSHPKRSAEAEGSECMGDTLPTTRSSNWSTTTDSWSLRSVVIPVISTTSSAVVLPLPNGTSEWVCSFKSTVPTSLSCWLFLDRLRAALDSMTLLTTAEQKLAWQLESRAGRLTCDR